MRVVKVSVHGLSCSGCVSAVQAATTSIPFVQSAKVTLAAWPAASTLTAHLSPSAPPDAEILAALRISLPSKYSPLALLPAANEHNAEPLPPPQSASSTASTDDEGPTVEITAVKQRPPRVIRRFRCGCAALSCRCSAVRVIQSDPGVLVRVAIADPAPRSPDLASCSCAEACNTPVQGPGGARCSCTSFPPSAPREVVLSLRNLTCGSCVSSVRALLLGHPGIISASVTLLPARAVIQVLPAFALAPLLTALAAAGYPSSEIPRTTADPDDVVLAFSDLRTARAAVNALRASPHVTSADLALLPAAAEKRACFCPASSRASPPPFVRLTCIDKLASVATLDARADLLPYDVVPRHDPRLSGAIEPVHQLEMEARRLFRLFLGAALFTLPLALATMVFARVRALGGATLSQHVGRSAVRIVDVIALVLATPVQFVFGYRFYRGSWFALKRFRANMDVLIAAGTTIAYSFSVVVLILRTVQIRKGLEVTDEGVVFETSALLITIVLFGKWMETLAKKRTAASVEALGKLAPRGVTLVSPLPAAVPIFDEPVDVELVSVGDLFRVNPGASFPLDGIVQLGQTTADESMLTGESWPVTKNPGDPVYAGTVNEARVVVVRCTASDSNSMLEKIINLVKRAQAARAPIEAFADRVSSVFVPVVLIIALAVTVLWFSLAQMGKLPESWTAGEGHVLFSVLFGLSVLVIACPCALGLATPTVIMVATSIGARKLGILYKDGGEALQAANNIEAVLFDKTGTLTVGNPVVTSAAILGSNNEDITVVGGGNSTEIPKRVLAIIAAAESSSDHPLAKAIVAYTETHANEAEDTVAIANHEAVAGNGVRCTLENGTRIVIGQSSWVTAECGWRLSRRCEAVFSDWEACGKTVVLAHVVNACMVAFGIEDPVRYESARVISNLQQKGVTCGIVTGDSLGTAKAVAQIVGIAEDHIYARALPVEKVSVVQTFLSTRERSSDVEANMRANKVAFVGDGINDAGALSAASVGIAMGSGSQIATESAGIVLVRSNLWDVVTALDLAHKAFGRIKLNYVWALGYNCLGIPLAAGAVYPLLQKRIPPYAAAAAMGLSSLSVILSSLSLGSYKNPTLQYAQTRE